VEVHSSWSEDDRFAEIVVKQKQEAEAFHFPLEVEFRFDDATAVFMSRPVTEKEHRFLFHLPRHPDMVIVDPRSAVLMELTEKKSRDWEIKQLMRAPYAVSRIHAAQQLGEEGGRAAVEALASALATESFWGVAERIAQALGKAGGDAARDALLAGLALPHPKARRECAEQLAKFHKDEKVIAALRELVAKGDPSYRVEASAIRTYGELQPDDSLPFVLTLLGRDSHRDQIRSAALAAIGKLKDPAALDTLLDYAEPGRPRFTRSAAIGALGDMAETAELTDEDRSRIIAALEVRLGEPGRWIRGSAVRALEQFGESARPALPALRALVAHEPERRIRQAAERAIERITKGSPPAAQVDDLRDELKTLRNANDSLQRRLEELEAHFTHDAEPAKTD
jgi:aminopeptidase N